MKSIIKYLTNDTDVEQIKYKLKAKIDNAVKAKYGPGHNGRIEWAY